MFVNASNQKLLQLFLEEWLSLILIVVWTEANLQTLILMLYVRLSVCFFAGLMFYKIFHNQKEAF